jgi:hypothetical protein
MTPTEIEKIELATGPFFRTHKMSTSSYIPGTKLSFDNGNECCTVLTNGNAMVTKAWGDRWWEQMLLADWLILAEGQEQEDFIPVSNHVEHDEYADMPPLIPINQNNINHFWNNLVYTTAEQDARPPAVTYPKRPIGTKLKWVLDDETYRIAVVTKDGVCQVKAITEGGGDSYFDYETNRRYLTKRTFDSEASWRSNLPQGGKVFVY